MKRIHTISVKLALVALAALACVAAIAEDPQVYEVTVTNLTRGQVLSPPVVASHGHGFRLFQAGQPASPELAAVAEDADETGLVALLQTQRGIHAVGVGAGPIPPGQSATIEIEVSGRYRELSLASMLVTTNDAFAAVRGLRVHPSRMVTTTAVAYDAGSEANNESCDYIPGPPCGNRFQRAAAGAEGYVHVHGGIHGGASLTPSMHDWRNPVAQVSVKRVR